MRHIKTIALTTVASVAMLAIPAFAAVSPVTATYKANYMGMSATGKMEVSAVGGGRYKTVLSVSNPLGFSSQVTVFDEKGGELRPLSSVDSSKFMGKKSESKATYDWAKGTASWEGNISDDKKGPTRMVAGDMDALLVNLAIVRDVNAGKSLDYRLLENGKAKPMKYSIAGKETITVAGKSVSATKVVGTGNKPIILWVAPGYDVPVKIEKVVDMGKMTLSLASID